MGYSEYELQELKDRNPVMDVFRERGFELVKRGKHYATRCPFHEDKDPSLIITPENNLWNCLGCPPGSGKTGGDVIEFVEKLDGVGFIGAVEYLKKRSGNGSSPACPPVAAKKTTTKTATSQEKTATKIKSSIQHQKILGKVMDFYHRTFAEDKRGYSYLKQRGIDDPKIYDTFRIGFANGSLFGTIPEKGEVVDALKDMGILSKEGHELFRDCVVLPIYDKAGGVVHVYGRKVVDEPVKHLYLSGPHRGVFNHHILKSYNEIILTESIIDSLSLYQAGFKNTIPCYGVNGLTEDHLKTFKEYNTNEIIILFDGDDVGRRAAQAIKERLYSFSSRIVALPDGEDPNSYLLGHSPEELELLVWGTTKKKEPTGIGPKKIEDGFIVEFCQRKYIIRGVEGGINKLKANIRAEGRRKFHIDTVDLYSAKARKLFIRDVVMLFREDHDIIEQDIDRIIVAVEQYAAQRKSQRDTPVVKVLSAEERAQAIRFGKSKDLIGQILKDVERCGYVGEEMNKLICYLAMTSRKMSDPLSILMLSGSGAGKTSLQDTMLSLCPEEDLLKLTSLTGKALFYKKECSLTHKVLAIEEERGAEDATYAIRNLISSKELSIEATIKDVYTGKMTTMENRVSGPTSVFKTTTDPDTDPETRSRFITISVDESWEQTKRILEYQRESYTMDGYLKKQDKKGIIEVHRNFQRLLRPLQVFNPYAKLLTYLDDRVLMRREHPKYMNIINVVTFLHQLQREVKVNKAHGQVIEYIEVTLEDIQMANEIAHFILGRSLSELPDPSVNLLNLIHEMVCEIANKAEKKPEEILFIRRMIREYTKWSDYQIKMHIRVLEDLEYLVPIAGSAGKQFRYRLAYNGEGQDGSRFCLGLINVEQLKEKARLVGTG